MKKLLIKSLILVLSCTFLVGGWHQKEFSGAEAKEKIVLKYGHLFAEGHNLHIVGSWMKKELAKRTNGRVEFKIYPNAILGNESEMVEGIRMGTLDMTPTGGPLGAWVTKVRVLDMPYLIESFEHFKKCYIEPGPVGKKLAEEVLQKANLRVLGWFAQGHRITVTRTRLISKLEDFKGVKIRVHENPLVVGTFRALGAEAVPMAWGEVYTSLKTKVIDACEGPASSLGVARMTEVAPYISHTNHFFLVVALVIGEKQFQALPADIQKVVLDVGKESGYVMLDVLKKNIEDGLKQMKSVPGTKEAWPDLKPFREAVQPVIKEFGAKYGVEDLVETIRSFK